MGTQTNTNKEFMVVIDGYVPELVTGSRAVISCHGYLDIQDHLGESVAIFARFDSVIAKPAEQE